jgi:hypothetical protein
MNKDGLGITNLERHGRALQLRWLWHEIAGEAMQGV